MIKRERQRELLRIISSKDVETQHQLILELNARGISSTQATLSRDMKELHLVKESTPEGNYRYVALLTPEYENNAAKLKAIFKDSVISCDVAMNIIVIKTLPGLAPAACTVIDAMVVHNLVGTIAGDDTIFLAMRDVESATKFSLEIDDMR